MAVLLGADIGGTFTDFVAHDDRTGQTEVWKVPSVPGDPVRAILDGLADYPGRDGLGHLRIGTTVATNAILQRQGAVTAYVTTKGFRDIPFIQRGNRKHHYDEPAQKARSPAPERSQAITAGSGDLRSLRHDDRVEEDQRSGPAWVRRPSR